MAADPDQVLQGMIEALQTVPNVVHEALPEIAAECKDIIAANVAAQRGPDGVPWAPGKRGQPVLKNAAAAVQAQAIGNVVLITLTGPEALHHKGRVRGRTKREIIPTGKLPQPMSEAISRVLARRLESGE